MPACPRSRHLPSAAMQGVEAVRGVAEGMEVTVAEGSAEGGSAAKEAVMEVAVTEVRRSHLRSI